MTKDFVEMSNTIHDSRYIEYRFIMSEPKVSFSYYDIKIHALLLCAVCIQMTRTFEAKHS
jgi:hypothetical protein